MTKGHFFGELTALNVASWDERASIHATDKTGFYAVDRFLAGEDVLLPIESLEIGPVSNKTLLHLQCHIGLETLSLARRGAIAYGLDFSKSSIEAAKTIRDRAKVNAEFIVGDVYESNSLFSFQFDIVYVSWGSLNWLPDIKHWAEVVSRHVSRGGFIYIIDQHPSFASLKWQEGRLTPKFSFRTPVKKPIVTDLPVSYNEDTKPLKNTRIHEWIHPLSDIINSLISNGFAIDYMREHERLAWKSQPFMLMTKDRMYCLPADYVPLPLSFSLRATKL